MSREEDKFYEKEILKLRAHLSQRIGFNYNRTWHSAAFWSNFSTPINLSLTLLTALIAADASATGNLVSKDQYMILSFTTMILTTINSYFKPHIKSTDANDSLTKWLEHGHKLETLEFSDETEKQKYEHYKELLKDTNLLIKNQAYKDRNFLTDWFHSLTRWWRGEEKDNWGLKAENAKRENKDEKKNEVVIEMTKIKK